MKSVAEEWLTYRTLVMPKDAGEIQVRECRRAFYAGATAFFGLMLTAMEPGTDPTDDDIAKVDKLHKELESFMDRVLEKQA